MALLPIITAPDPRLKLKAKPVAQVDDEVRRLMDDMMETMYAAPGIGLAAPQVGIVSRVIVVDLGDGLRLELQARVGSRDDRQQGHKGESPLNR